MKPRLLDLFCGAGGCSMGYHRAGFDVVGVDLKPQKRYPFEFHQGDALEFLRQHGHEFDAIHASPPCQAYSQTRTIHRGKKTEKPHPDLLAPTRDHLQLWAMRGGGRWVIENVPGANMMYPIMLCGTFFNLRVQRHRLFESNAAIMAPGNHCAHPPRGSFIQAGRPAKEGDWMIVAGHFTSLPVARKAMGIDWMTRDELAQAIPPAYTEFIGKQLLRFL